MAELTSLLSSTEVHARGLRWEIVGMLQQGEKTVVRLRGVEGAMLGNANKSSLGVR